VDNADYLGWRKALIDKIKNEEDYALFYPPELNGLLDLVAQLEIEEE
jgi:hypothetical protein